MNRLPFTAIVLALAHFAVACSSKPPTQPSDPTPPIVTPPPVTLKTVSIAGDARLTAIGGTSQLTGTATFTDGSTTDVTSAAKWFVGDPSVVSVSPSGLATALRFGSAYAYVLFEGRGQGLQIIVTPPDTFTVSGSVREPGYDGLANVRVLDTRSGRSTTTSVEGFSDAGEFSFGDLTQDAHLRVEPDGYEPVEIDAPVGASLDVKVQRIVRVTAGETVHPVTPLAFDDLEYTMTSGARCVPCRLIRIDVPVAGTLHLRLTCADSTSLALWVNGQQFSQARGPVVINVDVPASAGETLVYVQLLNPRTNQTVPAVTLDTSVKP